MVVNQLEVPFIVSPIWLFQFVKKLVIHLYILDLSITADESELNHVWMIHESIVCFLDLLDNPDAVSGPVIFFRCKVSASNHAARFDNR